MNKISIIDMFKAKVHLGHLKRFISPKMKKYIYAINNKISIIDLDLTLKQIIKSLDFIESIIKKNGTILFVGTKRQASSLVKVYASKLNMPYINFRWLGGLLTNYDTVKKSIVKLNELEKNISKNHFKYLTKKECLIKKKKIKRLKLNFDGIKNMTKIPNVIFVIDVNYEKIAVLEANKLSIPVIGIVDTNSNPGGVNYMIAGNDDAMSSIKFYLEIIYNHIIRINYLRGYNK